MTLPAFGQIQAQIGIISDDLATFEKEWRWLESGFWRPDKTEKVPVAGGGISDPTQGAAVGTPYERRRRYAEGAWRKLTEAKNDMEAALGLLATALDTYPRPGEDPTNPSKDIVWDHQARSGSHKAFIRRQKRRQLQRTAEGKGYGEE